MEEEDFERKWQKVVYHLIQLTGKKPNLDIILFMIGVQELGKGQQEFTKEQKQDLMHIAVCKVLSYSGYYELEGQDQDGWPHWKNVKPVPKLSLEEQEKFLQHHIIDYFELEVFT
jgi:sensor domain CHASE-containing protein